MRDGDWKGKMFFHVKTGHYYEVLGFGIIEATLEPAVIYASTGSSMVWIRPIKEFFDGRFVLQGLEPQT